MNWIFNDSQSAPLFQLSQSIKEKTLFSVNDKMGEKFFHYSPFMCNLDNINILSPLFDIKSLIVNEKSSLEVISKLYSMDGEKSGEVKPSHINDQDYKVYERAIKLVGTVPSLKVIFSFLIQHIIPIHEKVRQKTGSGSSNILVRGAIFLSVPKSKELGFIQLAINMAHELGHQCLMVYQVSDRIIEGNLDDLVYSYVRKTKRPIIQSFHASFALLFMVEFLSKVDRKLLSSKEVEFLEIQREKMRGDFLASLKEFKNEQFTEFGSVLFGELREYAKQA